MNALVAGATVSAQDPTADYLDRCRRDSTDARELRGCIGMVHTEGDVPGWTRGLMQRPLFRSRRDSDSLCADLASLADAVESVVSRMYGDSSQFLRELGVPDADLEMISVGSVGKVAQFMRADVLFEAGRPQVVELNNDCLGGLGMAKVNTALMGHRAFASFAQEHDLSYVDTRDCVVERLVAAAPEPCCGERPKIALVEERNSGLLAKFIVQDLARDPRIDVVHGELDQLNVRSTGTYCREEQVDVVFRYFVASRSVPDDLRTIRALTEEQLAGRLGLVTTLDSELLNRKTLFGWLWEPAVRADMGADLRTVVDRLVPWTCCYIPAFSPGRPLAVDLVEKCMDSRPELVIKPAEGGRSDGVLFGDQLTEADWRSQLSRTDMAFVVQRRVRPDEEMILEPATGLPVQWHVNYGYFQFDGRYAGVFLRGRHADNEGPIGAPGPDTRLGCAFDY